MRNFRCTDRVESVPSGASALRCRSSTDPLIVGRAPRVAAPANRGPDDVIVGSTSSFLPKRLTVPPKDPKVSSAARAFVCEA